MFRQTRAGEAVDVAGVSDRRVLLYGSALCRPGNHSITFGERLGNRARIVEESTLDKCQ